MFKFVAARTNILLLLMPLGIAGCRLSSPAVEPVSEIGRSDTQLVLNKAVLEQSNQINNTVWKIKADNITYSGDNKIASLTKVVGNLLQNDSVILKISAETGEIKDNGNLILLDGAVIASDPRNGSVIDSESVEWRPQENLLLIKEQLNGTHPNLKVVAQSGQYSTDTEELVVEGDVVATSQKPALQLTSDRLDWNIPQEQITSPGAVQLVRFDLNRNITDKLVSDRAELNLAQNQATLQQNIELISADPRLQIATDFLTWNYQARIGKTDRPIQIVDRDRQISLTGNRGEINFPLQIAELQGGVRGINRQKASELYARNLTWNIDTEEVEAKGNVVYEQAEPKARLTGEKAVGTLGNNNITVTSNGKRQVTSVIEN